MTSHDFRIFLDASRRTHIDSGYSTRSKTAISPEAAVPGLSSTDFCDLEEGGFRGLCHVLGRSDGGTWFVVVLKWVGDGLAASARMSEHGLSSLEEKRRTDVG